MRFSAPCLNQIARPVCEDRCPATLWIDIHAQFFVWSCGLMRIRHWYPGSMHRYRPGIGRSGPREIHDRLGKMLRACCFVAAGQRVNINFLRAGYARGLSDGDPTRAAAAVLQACRQAAGGPADLPSESPMDN
jgi:hypothetical protein